MPRKSTKTKRSLKQFGIPKRAALFVALFIVAGLVTLIISLAATTTRTVVYTSNADATIRSGPKASENYGSTTYLRTSTVNGPCGALVVTNCNKDYDIRSLIRFYVGAFPTGYKLKTATLRMYVNDNSPVGGIIYGTGNGWSEASVTWNTQPPLGTVLGYNGPANIGQWLGFPLNKDKISPSSNNSFILTSNNQNVAGFDSRETTHPPQLVLVFEKVDTTTTTPPPPPPSSDCSGTANVKSLSSLAAYAQLPGNQVVVVPNGTYAGGGAVTTAHTNTSGVCKGWLVLKAAERGRAVIDLSRGGFTLNQPASRIAFVGFKFINGGVDVNTSHMIFYYTDHSANPSHSSAVLDGLYLNDDSADNIHLYGSDVRDACDGIDLSGASNVSLTGVVVKDMYDADGDGSSCHADNLDDVQGKLDRLSVNQSWIKGRIEVEARKGNVSLAFSNSWVSNSRGAGMALFEDGYNITGSLTNVRFFDNNGSDLIGGSNLSQSGVVFASPGTATDPATNWRSSNPYESWQNVLY